MTRRNRRSPANYLRGLFDRFADHYDRAMIDGLRYQAHWQIRDLAARHLLPDLTLLELGCGTGLLGKALRELMRIRRLDGIDISPRMIAAAKASAAYDRLVLGDIEKILAEPDSLYDAVVSSDALNYFGDLSAIIAGVSRRLKAGGLFLFTTEMFDGEGWQQTPVHRFQHSQQYLRTEAERSGFEIVEIRPCTLRFENGRPVAGFVIVLTKPLAGQQ